MNEIRRIGNSRRWADVVIYAGVARWVEVAEDITADTTGQIEQVLRQINATLALVQSDRERLLEALIFLADLGDASLLNQLWDQWVEGGNPPIRACVQAGLSAGLRVEMVLTAAVSERL